jgi:dystrophin
MYLVFILISLILST